MGPSGKGTTSSRAVSRQAWSGFSHRGQDDQWRKTPAASVTTDSLIHDAPRIGLSETTRPFFTRDNQFGSRISRNHLITCRNSDYPATKAMCVARVGNNNDGVMKRDEQYESRINTRQHQRYELETELTANICRGERREAMRGQCLNINEGGIAGLFAIGWDVGTSVNLQFSVPIATAPLRVSAVVRNRTSYRYGFEFINLTPEQRETISRTCRTLGLLQ